MPSLTVTNGVEDKGKAFVLGLMQIYLLVVLGITVWGVGEFAWKMLT